MNVKIASDGKLLVICRAGCTIQDIIEATGLGWRVFFPNQGTPYKDFRREVRSFPAQDILAALDFELEIARIALADLVNGAPMSEGDRARFALAIQRIQHAIRIGRGEF